MLVLCFAATPQINSQSGLKDENQQSTSDYEKYDKNGNDINGFDKEGYDRDGRDKNGNYRSANIGIDYDENTGNTGDGKKEVKTDYNTGEPQAPPSSDTPSKTSDYTTPKEK
jgi:hypothetical protein